MFHMLTCQDPMVRLTEGLNDRKRGRKWGMLGSEGWKWAPHHPIPVLILEIYPNSRFDPIFQFVMMIYFQGMVGDNVCISLFGLFVKKNI